MEDYVNELQRRLARLEREIDDLRSADIASEVFEHTPPKADETQRVFATGGQSTTGPKPFDLRFAWRESTDGDGNPISVRVVDIYQPSLQYFLYSNNSAHSGIYVEASMANALPSVGDDWYQLCEVSQWQALSTSASPLVFLDVTGLTSDIEGTSERSFTLRIGTSASGSVWLTPNAGTSPAENAQLLALGTLYIESSSVVQQCNGMCRIVPERGYGQSLYIKVGDKLVPVSDYTGSYTKESELYLVTLFVTKYKFDNTTIEGDTLVPIGQSDASQHFASIIPCRVHAADHYDNFIPEA